MADVLPISLTISPSSGAGFDALEALQNIPLVLIIADKLGEVIFVNIAAEQFFLSSSRLLKTNGLDAIFGQKENLKLHINQVATNQSSITLRQVEVEKTPKENILSDISLTTFAGLLNSAEPLVLITMQPHDKKYKATANNAQHVASLADMLAHEVKNPLSGIRGAAQLLEQNADEEDKKLTQIICQECDRIRTLVESMEHFSSEQELDFSGVNIHHVLDHVIEVSKVGFASSINIQTIYDPSLPLVRANYDALVQVILNLVKNAAESIEIEGRAGRGEITIKTAYSHGGNTKENQSFSSVFAPIEITIHDNGTGIPKALLGNLFEPFVTRKKVGKGLGLALVDKLLNLHQASIFAENTAVGAQFKLYLPLFSDNEGRAKS
jgi:two-component system nitrogen regulation sensor histidine kinase GlnL